MIRNVDGPIEDVSFSIRVEGPDEGKTLLWLHGEWGPLDAELRVLYELSASGIRVIVPTQPGWMGSGGDSRLPSLTDVATAYLWLLDELGVSTVTVAGAGSGAALAAEIATLIPSAVDGLLLVNPAGIWDDSLPGEDLFALMPRDLPSALFVDTGSQAAMELFPKPADAYEAGVQNIRRAQALGAAGRYMFPLFDTGIRRRLYRLATVPTRVLWGADNKILAPGLLDVWLSEIPHATGAAIPSAGHMLAIERPDVLLEELSVIASQASPAPTQ